MPNLKTRLWCFTNYDLDFNYQELIDADKCRYVAYGLETCPTTGRKHHQGFIWFKNPRGSIKGVANMLGKCHVEPARGRLQDNEKYCSKEGKLVEFGEKPTQGRRSDLAEMMEAVADGVSELDLAEQNPQLWCMYGKRLKEYRMLKQPRRTWKTQVFVFWGASGTGKTRAAWAEGGPDMDDVSFCNGFIVGYTNAEAVLFDDFRWGDWDKPHKRHERTTFMQLLDRYGKTVNVKNGRAQWNPRRIFITTNINPEFWSNDAETREGIMRRIAEDGGESRFFK